jgi:hypothetical protein
MSIKRKPICFIAMAFGYDDTDKFFIKLVLPVLKRNNITPIIINRHQSNDDLNIQIIEQLKNADFCITDLTYARPSVYFEAGFAQREVPVIYTVRKDHLDKGQPDDSRVHFDLQMKPLITWKDQNDKTFSSRLEVRIKSTFLASWIKKQNTNHKYEQAEALFKLAPPDERLAKLRKYCIQELIKKGYSKANWETNIDFRDNYTRSYSQEVVLAGRINYVYSYKYIPPNNKNISPKLFVASIQSFTNLTKNELVSIDRMYRSTYFLSQNTTQVMKKNKIQSVNINAFILGLNDFSTARIENALPHVTPVQHSKWYSITYERQNPFFIISANYYFLSGIKSLDQLEDELKNNVLNHLPSES